MLRSLTVIALLLSAVTIHAQYAPTHCQTTTATAFGLQMKVLLGCSDGFAENTLWHLDRTDQIPPALDGRAYRGHGGKGSVIYIMDTGILATHDEFMTATGSRVIAGLDAMGSVPGSAASCRHPNPPLDPCADTPLPIALISHGTAVASVAAGKNVGMAPEAYLVAVRVIALTSPFLSLRTVSDGLDMIVRHAYDPSTPQFSTGIISISFAVAADSFLDLTPDQVEAKMRRMTEGVDRDNHPDPNGKRFLFTIAAGNSNQGEQEWCQPGGVTKLFPSTIGPRIRGAITVGGSAKDNTIWFGSCRGEEVFAPAEDLLVACLTAHDHYRDKASLLTSGTSWSAPAVAGIAARMLELDSSLTPQQLEDAIESSASKLATGETEAVFLPVAGDPIVSRRRAVRP
jgi:subtilisin family serine protease